MPRSGPEGKPDATSAGVMPISRSLLSALEPWTRVLLAPLDPGSMRCTSRRTAIARAILELLQHTGQTPAELARIVCVTAETVRTWIECEVDAHDGNLRILVEAGVKLPDWIKVEPAPSTFGEALRRWRRKHGWSRVRLAAAIARLTRSRAVSEKTIAAWESGLYKPTRWRLAAMVQMGFEPPVRHVPGVAQMYMEAA